MTKITPDHLARSAFVYIRQSTADQVLNNHESRRRQYGLEERARQLGWQDVVVIDDDLGRSGSGVNRPGFERLLAAICEGRAGAVFAIEASRLARNGRDWHTLIEFCGLVGAVIIDEDGVYEPRHPNDRLLLGMKGTMSELELSILRQRSIEALRQKARRGELFMTVAVGYVKVRHDRIEKDPDQRVREALTLVFSKFAEFQSMRQVHLWFRRENIALPVVRYSAEEGRSIAWRLPVYNTIHHILHNPIYAGAYAFGRTGSRVTIEAGRKRIVRGYRRERPDWEVLLLDHHEDYLSWAEFERNQRLIADNANGKSYLGRGSIRRGEALLPGLFRCARCGRKLQVSYGGRGTYSQRYACRGAFSERAEMSCISFGGMRVDRAIAREVLDRVQPLGIEAALAAVKSFGQEQSDKRRQLENALEQARYEAARAHRQYDAVDPGNRLVASDLERRWNEKLLGARTIEDQLAQLNAEPPAALSGLDRERLLALGADLSGAWDSPGVTVETRKKIVRLLISEIVVDVVDDTINLIIHWQGGDHTRLEVKKNKAGQTRWVTDVDVIELIRALARHLPDTSIAAILNRSGKLTGRGNGWTRARVCSLRHQRDIAPYVAGERAERGESTLNEAAKVLVVSSSTIRRMINTGLLPAEQLCKGAPWVIKNADLQREDIQREANCRRSRRPASHNPYQAMLDL
jgi:excisionase family DNA binding protein